MKNYVIEFISAPKIKLTAQEAAYITAAWLRGDSAIVFNGTVFPTHQITGIWPNKEWEKEYCKDKQPPRIEDFSSHKNLLT